MSFFTMPVVSWTTVSGYNWLFASSEQSHYMSPMLKLQVLTADRRRHEEDHARFDLPRHLTSCLSPQCVLSMFQMSLRPSTFHALALAEKPKTGVDNRHLSTAARRSIVRKLMSSCVRGVCCLVSVVATTFSPTRPQFLCSDWQALARRTAPMPCEDCATKTISRMHL